MKIFYLILFLLSLGCGNNSEKKEPFQEQFYAFEGFDSSRFSEKSLRENYSFLKNALQGTEYPTLIKARIAETLANRGGAAALVDLKELIEERKLSLELIPYIITSVVLPDEKTAEAFSLATSKGYPEISRKNISKNFKYFKKYP